MVAMTALTAGAAATRKGERRSLTWHFIEMVLAMLVGMAVLGAVAQGICSALGHPGYLTHHAGVRAPVMAVNMAIGMAAWMRYRGHGWATTGEMVAAMIAPLAVLIGPFFGGAVSGGSLLVFMHVLMFPCMAIAMLRRRDEYVHHHAGHPVRYLARRVR
jgi:hypothetical protein